MQAITSPWQDRSFFQVSKRLVHKRQANAIGGECDARGVVNVVDKVVDRPLHNITPQLSLRLHLRML